MTNSSPKIKLIIDTDCGVDDAVALWYALTCPIFEVELITCVHGNVGHDLVARNVARVLGAAGRTDIPVALGASDALAGSPVVGRAASVHGNDGLGDADLMDYTIEFDDLSADQAIVDRARRMPGQLTLAALGPATNVARALRLEPELPNLLGELIAMGGTFNLPGNISPVASFNTAGDPLAAKEMVNAAWPQPPRLLTYDVMRVTTLSSVELETLKASQSPSARFLARPMAYYHFATAGANAGGRMVCPDLLTLVWLTDPDAVNSNVYSMDVDVGRDAAWGMTVVDRREPSLIAVTEQSRHVDPAVTPTARWEISESADEAPFRAAFRHLLGT